MSKSTPVVATTGKRNLWPLAAVCCLGLLGLLVAGAIILALIPIYLPAKTVTVKNNTATEGDTFYLEYEVDGNGNSINTGSIENLSEVERHMNQLFGLNNELSVQTGQTQKAFVRRKRHLISGRNKRSIQTKCLFKCTPKFTQLCSSLNCRDGVTTRVQDACRKVQTLPNIPCNISSKQFGLTSNTLSLTFIALTLTRPSGFGGEPPTFGQFVAVQSGEFNNPSTWSEGIVPYEESSIIISFGIVVTLSNALLDLDVRQFDIFGTLALGSSANAAFTFQYTTNIIVHSGGALQDRTGNNQIYSPVGSLINIYPGGSFAGSNTVLSTYTSLPAANSKGNNITLDSNLSGPFTCGILLDGTIVVFNQITYIVALSGNFTTTSTWLGGTVPTTDLCDSAGGCGLYIPSGIKLTTAGLNNALNINFTLVLIDDGGVFQLGTPDVRSGFTFDFPISFLVESGGTIEDQTILHQIYCRPGSIFILFPNASFIGDNTEFFSYTSLPATDDLNDSIQLGSSLSGPATLAVLSDGTVQVFSELTLIPVVSGGFTTANTWLGGFYPYAGICEFPGGCGLYIPYGVTLTTAGLNNTLDITITSVIIDNGGVFQLGTPDVSGGFTFNFPISFLVEPGGKIQDTTTLHQIYSRPSSIFILLPNASFIGDNTQFFSYTSLPAVENIDKIVPLGSSLAGPATFAVLSDGTVQVFSELTLIPVVSGGFTTPNTWLGGFYPYAGICEFAGGCGLYIPYGVTLTTAGLNNTLDINFEFIIVDDGGLLQFGTPDISGGFTFNYPIHLIVGPGGTIQDETTLHEFYFLAGTEFDFYANASFIGTYIAILSYTSLPANESIADGGVLESPISGPFTIGILPDASVRYFNLITSIVAESGEFTVDSTWLSKSAPTLGGCDFAGGCGLYISYGVTLTTIDLNNTLDINFRFIIVDDGGLFQLGTPDISGGFTFNYPVNLIVGPGGTIEDETTLHEFYFPAGTEIDFYSNASFIGSYLFIISYTSLPANESLFDGVTLESPLSGPFTIGILLDGTVVYFNLITSIVYASGNFTTDGTWLSGSAPTLSGCDFAGGCGLYIPSGVTLATVDLDNTLDINFKFIYIDYGGILQLGNPDIIDGFTFNYPVNLIVYPGGTIADQTTLHKFYFPPGSEFDYYPNASLIGSYVFFFSYLSLPANGSLFEYFLFESPLPAPLTLGVLLDGTFVGFNGITAIAVTSGNFTTDSTWLSGSAPTFGGCEVAGVCGLYIPYAVALTTVDLDNTLYINFKFIIIDDGGLLQLGTPDIIDGFTFNYPVNLIANPGGTVEDQTTLHEFYFLPGSEIDFYSNASFIGSYVDILSYTSLPANESVFDGVTLESPISGPFTIGILFDGTVVYFNQITYIAAESGNFTTDSIWLDRYAPTADACDFAGGCGLYIPSGVTLATVDLDNTLDINFKFIIIDDGGSLQLGTPDLSGGFTFNYPVNLIVGPGGTIEDQTTLHEFYFPPGTEFDFYADASLIGDYVSILSYTSLPANGSLSGGVTLQSYFSGPFTIGILSDASVVTFDLITSIVYTSGNFTEDSTWLSGSAPTLGGCDFAGGCGLYIPPGLTLATVDLDNTLDINFMFIIVDDGGLLQLGTPNIDDGFTFNYPVNLIVYPGGTFEDETKFNAFFFLPGTELDFYANASLIGSYLFIFSYTSLPANENLFYIFVLKLPISGPLTIGILSDASIVPFGLITSIVAESGNFTEDSTWLSGSAPTLGGCDFAGGCGLYIPPGLTLGTVDLDNTLDINFKFIIIDDDGLLQVGAPDISGGFTFNYPVNLIVGPGGTIEDQTKLHEFFFLPGTEFDFYANASLIGDYVSIISYMSLPANESLSGGVTLQSYFSGPFTIGILSDASVVTFGLITSIVYTSGNFTEDSTWLSGSAPTLGGCDFAGGCGLYIPSGVTLATVDLDNTLDINFKFIIIDDGGLLQVGAPDISGGFTFNYPVNLIVEPGATIEDQTTLHEFYFPPGTEFDFYANASLIGDYVSVVSYTSLPANESLFDGVTLESPISGPFTIGILSDASIVSFDLITSIVYASGNFTEDSTWLSGSAPTLGGCDFAGGCGLYIPYGVTLATVDLDNTLDINFEFIIVDDGGLLQLGTPDVSGGFKFVFPPELDCYGELLYVSGDTGGIYLPPLSSLNIFPNGSFASSTNTSLFAFNPSTNNVTYGEPLSLGESISGPYYISISAAGNISVNTDAPGGNGTST